MKLCKDCRHMGHDPIKGAVCIRSQVVDYVYGKHSFYSCGNEREFKTTGGCGPDGLNWEAMEPLETALRIAGEAA